MKRGLDWRTARDELLQQVTPVDTQMLPLEQCGGRYLAENIAALQAVPPFDRSPLDGYAFRSADTAPDAPVTLRILEEVPAGHVPTCTVTEGTAVKILTGAPIPCGADAVSKFEETEFTPEYVTLKRQYRPGENIVFRGEDVSPGDLLGRKGQRIDAGLAGALAAQEIGEVTVHRIPKVGILTTGTELRRPSEANNSASIPNSNRTALETALRLLDCQPVFYGAPGDTVEEISSVLARALADCDMVVTTGGVSVGDYDCTPAAVEHCGAELLIQNLKLKPGGKCCFGVYKGKLIACLSGNPASGMTCFYAVVMPAIRRLTGAEHTAQKEVIAHITSDFPKGSKQPRLLRGVLDWAEEGLCFTPAPAQGNGTLHTLAGANAFAELPGGSGPIGAGEVVRVCYIGG